MIVAAGLTPAWQQILRFDELHLGEVNRAREAVWCASGKVLNVGLALQGLGAATHIVAPLGGWSGKAIEDELTGRGIAGSWIGVTAPTRVCTTVLDGTRNAATELVENAALLSAEEIARCTAAYCRAVAGAEFAVITGSLPRGTPSALLRSWLEATPSPVLLDVRGPELLECLPQRPRVVKPNREELGHTLGRKLTTRADLIAAMRELGQCGAQAVVVTHGKEDVLVMQDDDLWELTPPTVTPVVNPIGCGDCLAAGIAYGLSLGQSLLDAVRLGMAAAAENVSSLFPARIDRARLARWMSR